MFLIDDLLLSPISGFKFILRTLARTAEEQYTDDAAIKERLLELQNELEDGTVTEEEYVVEERAILAELRAIQQRKMEMAGITPEEAERMGRPMVEIPPEVKRHNEE
ncbi:MAG TPA: gas vesicle protein GvpG [Bryocella sp.]|nr:gas vesicle protein GvpG [Bryocella sp.]